MAVIMEIKGLEELSRRMSASPQRFDAALRKTLDAALLIIWETVPGYPPKPEGSTYDRTGMLGRTIGVSESGARVGKPEIYEIRKDGGYLAGRIGTALNYAPYVISESRQARWMSHWWTLDGTVARSALPKIREAFRVMAQRLAQYLARG